MLTAQVVQCLKNKIPPEHDMTPEGVCQVQLKWKYVCPIQKASCRIEKPCVCSRGNIFCPLTMGCVQAKM